jgi:hypothetical protein
LEEVPLQPKRETLLKKRSFYVRLALIAVGLNWLWEMGQMFAFESKPEDSRVKILAFCTLASVVDALVTVGIYGLTTRIYALNQKVFYLLAAALGASCAIFFEWFAYRFGLWSYGELMLLVPVLGIGVLPFVQLTILVPLAIWLTKKCFEQDLRVSKITDKSISL